MLKFADAGTVITAQYAVEVSVSEPVSGPKPPADKVCAVHCGAQPEAVPTFQVSRCAGIAMPE